MAVTDVTYHLRYIPPLEYDYEAKDNLADEDDELHFYTLDLANSEFKIWPIPETAGYYFYLRYYKKMADLESYGDETDIPLPQMLEDYATSEILRMKGEEARATIYEQKFLDGIKLLSQMQKKQVGQPESLIRFRGRKPLQRYYGEPRVYDDSSKEKYW